MNGKFVLENQSGQVARVLNWQADVAYFVLLHESKRVEALPSLKELDNEGVDYTLIDRIEKSAVLKNPVKLINLGRVKFLQEVEKLSPQASEDSDEEKDKKIIPYIFKWTFGAGIGAVALLVALGHFLAPNIENNEPQVVTITPRLEKKLPVVTPHKIIKTPPPTVAQKIKKVKKTSEIAQVRQVKKAVKREKQINLNQMGDLAVLGSLNQSQNKGGLKLDKAQVTRGPGLGGSQGSGGMQTTTYGKGLIVAPLGPNAQAQGSGGYGKKGPGGGLGGAGKLNLIGSSTAFFQPVVSDTVLEGGLDSAQIAEVIQRHLGQIRYCYEQGLQTHPDLNGRVAIKFLISGSGQVTTAQVTSSSLKSQPVEECLVTKLKSWPFPKPRGGVVVKVNYPFVLKRMSQG